MLKQLKAKVDELCKRPDLTGVVADLQTCVDELKAVTQPVITVDRKTRPLAWAGIRTDGTTFGASFVEDSEGQWTMTFTDPHPSGSGGWLYSNGGSEDAERDNPKIALVEGTDTSTGAQIMVTVDDNGGTADIFEDNDYSFIVYAECEFIENVYVDGLPVESNSVDGGGGDGDGDGDGDGGGESQLSETYLIQQWQDNGFFFGPDGPNTAMNGQIQIFNTDTVPGPASWELKFDANYLIDSLTPSAGYTIGSVAPTSDNGTTYTYCIPVTGAIPGNNGNLQISINGTRHPSSTDTAALHFNEGVYV